MEDMGRLEDDIRSALALSLITTDLEATHIASTLEYVAQTLRRNTDPGKVATPSVVLRRHPVLDYNSVHENTRSMLRARYVYLLNACGLEWSPSDDEAFETLDEMADRMAVRASQRLAPQKAQTAVSEVSPGPDEPDAGREDVGRPGPAPGQAPGELGDASIETYQPLKKQPAAKS